MPRVTETSHMSNFKIRDLCYLLSFYHTHEKEETELTERMTN